ncbi:MAG: enolase [Candidatus Aenigmatarchaeota archaeon]
MIKSLKLSKTRNSRGDDTIKACINGKFCASAPSGRSTGKYEARTRPVESILRNSKALEKSFIGLKSFKDVDKKLEKMGIDRVGANFSIALSIAAARTEGNGDAYRALGGIRSFPYPLGNVVGGGAHRGNTDIQEFLVFPRRAKTMAEALKMNRDVWREAGRRLRARKKNDEGAWITAADDYRTLDALTEIAEENRCLVGIDMAATQLWDGKNYVYRKLGMRMDTGLQMDFIEGLVKTYSLAYVEDPFHESDFSSFALLKRKVKCVVCGDDLFATHAGRIRGAANAIIIKPDQAGTVTRTLAAISKAKRLKMATVVSHRSGETTDAFIADLAVATGARLIKCGISGREREAKHRRLVELWRKAARPRMA